jgi:photosystem II stability/assembly factor-like uncharacterized protein
MKRIILILILFKAILLQAQTNWYYQNPYPTAEDLNDIFVFNSENVIAVGDFGTVVRTSNNGSNWEISHKTENITSNLESVYFINENIGWATGYYYGDHDSSIVIKTIDKGKTWDLVSVDIPCEFNSIFFINENKGFACGSRVYDSGINANLYMSTDGGFSWDSVSTNTSIELNELCFINESVGWIGSRDGIILKTIDGGENWEQKNVGTNGNVVSLSFVNENKGYVISGDNILTTIDGGENWFILDFGIGWSPDYLYSVYFQNEHNGWILGGSNYGNYIFRTTNGGLTWSYVSYEGWQNSFGYNMHKLNSIQFSDANNGFIAGEGGIILQSNDSGETWNQKFDKTNSGPYLITSNKPSTLWAAGGEGVVLKSSNGGATWNWLNSITSDNISYINFFDEVNGIIISENRTHNTSDGGDTWSTRFTNNYKMSNFHFLNPDTGFAIKTVYSYLGGGKYTATILKTIDNGQTWVEKESFSSPWSFSFAKFQFINSQIGFIVEEDHFCKTIDGGETWDCEWLGQPFNYPKAIYFLNEDTGWVVGHGNSLHGPSYSVSRISKTIDGGETWIDQDCGDNPWLYTVYFHDENIGWAGGDEGVFHTTTDGGTTWSNLKISSKDLRNIFAYDINNVWVTGEDGLIMHTNDKQSYKTIENITICEGNDYQGWTENGTYSQNYISSDGQDSILITHLKLIPTVYSTDVFSICEGDSVFVGGSYQKEAGMYYDTLLSYLGCDSLVTTELIVNSSSGSTQDICICDGERYILGENVYTETGTYYDTISNSLGCDSIIIINLQILDNSIVSINATACGYYLSVSGKILEESGVYFDTIPNYLGCDSVITLDLTIIKVDTGVSSNGMTLTSNAASASYQWLDCQNNYSMIIGETTNSYTPTLSGSYAVAVTQSECTDTSDCYIITVTTDIIQNDFGNSLLIYPNPTKKSITIELGNLYDDVDLQVTNYLGLVILTQKYGITDKIQFEIEGQQGLYLLYIKTEDRKKAIIRFIKN